MERRRVDVPGNSAYHEGKSVGGGCGLVHMENPRLGRVQAHGWSVGRCFMKRREFLRLTALSTATLAIPREAFGAEVEDVKRSSTFKPNIILIVADDLGYGDLGCYGQERIKTPFLDQMAADGMRFTQFYGGSTVCAPSRCSLMTGLHTGHCRIRGNDDVLLEPEDTTIAELLKEAGYTTGCIGKWGIGHPPPPDDPAKNGFDYFFGYLSMWHAHNYYTDFLWKNGEKIPLRNKVRHPETHYRPAQIELVGVATERVDYSHDLFTEQALEFIENNQEQPFFLYLPYTIPHANSEAGDKGMEVPDYGIYENEDWPEPQKGHAAMISRMDRDVGRLLAKLKALGLDERTLVIFTSDNGPPRAGGNDPDFNDSNGPLRGIKRDLYEGGIRVPMIARWPAQIDQRVVNDHVSAFWDFLPTFTELAGAQPLEDIDGISMLPALLGHPVAQKQHEYLYWEFHEGGFVQAVRMGDWKGVRFGGKGGLELYNLRTDIGEKKDISGQHPDIVGKIEAYIETARTFSEFWPVSKTAERLHR